MKVSAQYAATHFDAILSAAGNPVDAQNFQHYA